MCHKKEDGEAYNGRDRMQEPLVSASFSIHKNDPERSDEHEKDQEVQYEKPVLPNMKLDNQNTMKHANTTL
jgi:hypothetical protein